MRHLRLTVVALCTGMLWAMLPIGFAGAQSVSIIVAPESRGNTISSGQAIETVAVLGPAGPTADISTLCFGDATRPRSRNCNPVLPTRLSDVNHDGILDLEVRFAIATSGIRQGDTVACLHGELSGGVPFEACGPIRTP